MTKPKVPTPTERRLIGSHLLSTFNRRSIGPQQRGTGAGGFVAAVRLDVSHVRDIRNATRSSRTHIPTASKIFRRQP